MASIVGLAGSLRKDSYNLRLLKAAAECVPNAHTLEVASIRGIPLYDGDLESESGVPDVVRALKDRLVASDGLLLVTPEYNNSLPGPFKNAIDWLSRPPKDISRVFGGRPVGIIGATPGRGGTRLAQTAWLPVVRTLGMIPYFGDSVYLAGAADVFDEERIVDEKVRDLVAKYVAGFVQFVETVRAAR